MSHLQKLIALLSRTITTKNDSTTNLRVITNTTLTYGGKNAFSPEKTWVNNLERPIQLELSLKKESPTPNIIKINTQKDKSSKSINGKKFLGNWSKTKLTDKLFLLLSEELI